MERNEIAVNELATFAKQKAHMDSVVRLMVLLQQELRDAGVKGTSESLTELKAAITDHQGEIDRKFDDAIFGLTVSEE